MKQKNDENRTIIKIKKKTVQLGGWKEVKWLLCDGREGDEVADFLGSTEQEPKEPLQQTA